jgi:hypothetical protein
MENNILGRQGPDVVHPAPYPMGTRGPFPGLKRGRGVTLTTHSV